MKPRSCWTYGEIEALRVVYPDHPAIDIARALGKDVDQVYRKAHRLGLSKSQAFYESDRSGRRQRGQVDPRMVVHQFKPGHVPANKGKKCPTRGRAGETQFKPGNRPHTWVPVGTYRVNPDGFVEFKFSDDPGPYTKRWVPVHRMVWQLAHGPIPRGHVVAFKGPRTTVPEEITLDRLELITCAENMRRNSIHTRLPPEVRRLVQLKGAITRQVNRIAKESEK